MTRSLSSTTRNPLLVSWAIGLTSAAQVLIGVLSLRFAPVVDPLRDPVSDYAFHRVARTWFAVAVLLVLAGAVALATAARLAGVPAGRTATVLFGLWAVSLVVVLLIPGNTSVAESTVHGELHRFGGAALFGSLPLACAALARRLREEPGLRRAASGLRGCAAAGMVTAAAFGAAQIVPELPAGLLERIALAAELAILVGLAVTIRSAGR